MNGSGFTLTQLQYFCAVAERGSFSSAAEAQKVTSNAISSAVNALEESLNNQLCVRRRSQGVELTATGRVFYQQALELLADADRLYNSVAQDDQTDDAPLSVGCIPTLSHTVLSRVTDELVRSHSNTRLNLEVHPQNVLIEKLQAGEVDTAFVYDIDLPEALERRELYRRTPQVMLSKKHRLASRKSINLLEMADERLIVLSTSPAKEYTIRLLSDLGIRPNIFYETTDSEVVRSLVARNFGFSITLLDTYIDTRDGAKTLVSVPIAPKHSDEGIVVAWTSAASERPQVRQIVEIATRDAARPRAARRF